MRVWNLLAAGVDGAAAVLRRLVAALVHVARLVSDVTGLPLVAVLLAAVVLLAAALVAADRFGARWAEREGGDR